MSVIVRIIDVHADREKTRQQTLTSTHFAGCFSSRMTAVAKHPLKG